MTYYLKYRPQTIEDLDLIHVRESLEKIIKSKNIPHAFLFSGPKGSGKTSAARILAKVVNCESTSVKLRGPGKVEPCNRCKTCKSITVGSSLDVIELDAASHRGIDDVRSLRDAVKLATAGSKKKVYIIDEAHMLTTEASNALLKTLEEPPSHVMFILATTNPEKLIETIRSRSVKINFKKASREEILSSLKKVVKGEKITIKDDALLSIAEAVDGSFRDAVKIFEQIVSEKIKLDKKNIEVFLRGSAPVSSSRIIEFLIERDVKSALSEVGEAYASGTQIGKLLESMITGLRASLLAKVGLGGEEIAGLSKRETIKLIDLLDKASTELPSAVLEQLPLELAIIEWCGEGKGSTSGTSSADSNTGKAEVSKIEILEELGEGEMLASSENSIKKLEDQESSAKSTKKRGKSEGKITDDIWNKILAGVKPKNHSTEALLRAAKPIDFNGRDLTLSVFYSFHKERLESAPHRVILEEVCSEIIGNPTRIVCVLRGHTDMEQHSVEEVVLTQDEDNDILKIAEEIFSE